METSLHGFLPDEMLLDHPELDAQHEEIFSRIEALRFACLDNDQSLVGEIRALLLYLEHHFATEERIAQEARLDFAEHAATHRQNLHVLNKALGELCGEAPDAHSHSSAGKKHRRGEVSSGGLDAHSLVRYIDHWFEHHIKEYDKPFAQRLPKSPQPARRVPTSQPASHLPA